MKILLILFIGVISLKASDIDIQRTEIKFVCKHDLHIPSSNTINLINAGDTVLRSILTEQAQKQFNFLNKNSSGLAQKMLPLATKNLRILRGYGHISLQNGHVISANDNHFIVTELIERQ